MLRNSCQLAEKPTHSSSEVSYPPWTGTTNVFVFSSASEIAMSTYALLHSSIYFLCKTKMADGHFVGFCHSLLSCSLFAEIDPLRTLYSRHPRYLGSLVAIQQRTHEKIANNRYELLFKWQPEHVGPHQILPTQPHPNQSNHVQTHYPVTDTFW